MPAILPIIYETLLLRSKSRVLQKQGFKTLTSKALKVNIVAQGIDLQRTDQSYASCFVNIS